jgi:DNA-binding response OmpR family regulator
MTDHSRHHALVVEDDRPTAELLAEMLEAAGHSSQVCDNRVAALEALDAESFCFILLDLQIKGDREAIQGHAFHGEALLGEIRSRFPQRVGRADWLPVIVISGVAGERDTAVEVMKFGASDLVHKPLDSQRILTAINSALLAAGRVQHSACETGPTVATGEGKVVIEIPGTKRKTRTAVVIGASTHWVPNKSLRIFLELVVAHLKSETVHKSRLGATEDPSFKAISTLRESLGEIGSKSGLITNDQAGNYGFASQVVIGRCGTDLLQQHQDFRVRELALEIAELKRSGGKA